MQEHQSNESVGPGRFGEPMRRQQCAKSDGFPTKLFADKRFPAERLATFIKQKVNNLQNPIEPGGKFSARGNLEMDPQVADFLPGASKALGNRRFANQKGGGNFHWAQTTKCLQSQRGLIFQRKLRMAAGKNKAKAVILDFVVESGRLSVIWLKLEESDDVWLLPASIDE